MKRVCDSCFKDIELSGYIQSQGEILTCSYCDNEDRYTIPINELLDFFSELFNEFEIDSNGKPLIEIIQENWEFFSTNELGLKIINDLLKLDKFPLFDATEKVVFSKEIRYNVGYWQKLKENIKWDSRYITDMDYITDELLWDGYLSDSILLNPANTYYRARVHPSETKYPFPADEMFAPKKEIASAGRANPKGIPYLYLSENIETTIFEVRASYLDLVSIGSFKTKDSKARYSIADFTNQPSLFYPNQIKETMISTLLKKTISDDLSKPMRRYDSDLDYIPTQFICEFIRVRIGVEGIKFKSSFKSKGNNLVLFNQEIMKCVKTELFRVNELDIKYDKI